MKQLAALTTVGFLMVFSQLLILGCSDSNSSDSDICYSFDKRQCEEVPWNNENTDDEKEGIKEYLEAQNIQVNWVDIDYDFHGIVCQACFVCPSGSRYFVNIKAEDENKLKELDLLSLELSDNCN